MNPFPNSPLYLSLWIMVFLANISSRTLPWVFLILSFLGCSVTHFLQWLRMCLQSISLAACLGFWVLRMPLYVIFSAIHFSLITLFFSSLSVRFKSKSSKSFCSGYVCIDMTCWLLRYITMYILESIGFFELECFIIFICLAGFLFYPSCLHFEVVKMWCVDSHSPLLSSVPCLTFHHVYCVQCSRPEISDSIFSGNTSWLYLGREEPFTLS